MGIIQYTQSFARNLSTIINGRQDVLIEPNPMLQGVGSGAVLSSGHALQRFFDGVRAPSARLAEMKYYDYLETEIADVRKALDAFATMAVTGNLVGGGKGSFQITRLREDVEYPDELLERLDDIAKVIQNNAYISVRKMLKYGTYTPQMIIERERGRRKVTKLKPIPPGTIYRNIDSSGRMDPMKYWIQVIKGQVVGGDQYDSSKMSNVGIPQWVLPHFALWSNVVTAEETLLYGTSILQPFGAIGLKVAASLDAMVVARLSRAAMRYVWKIDVSDIKTDQDQIRRRVNTWKNAVARSMSLLNSGENTDEFQRASVPDADFFVPAAEGLSWDLDQIEGDMNLGNTKDVELLTRFYFGALGVPPEYLGHERSQGGRSSLSQVDIHFARTVRHIQLFAVPAFEHIVLADMILGGWDPYEFPIAVTPPQIGARDDLLQAQIQALQSSVIANLVAAGLDPSTDPGWVLKTFMQFDEELNGLEKEQIEKLFIKPVIGRDTNESVQTPDQQQRIWNTMQRTTGDLMTVVRENMRLLLLSNDSMAGHLYDYSQPTPSELLTAINEAA